MNLQITDAEAEPMIVDLQEAATIVPVPTTPRGPRSILPLENIPTGVEGQPLLGTQIQVVQRMQTMTMSPAQSTNFVSFPGSPGTAVSADTPERAALRLANQILVEELQQAQNTKFFLSRCQRSIPLMSKPCMGA